MPGFSQAYRTLKLVGARNVDNPASGTGYAESMVLEDDLIIVNGTFRISIHGGCTGFVLA